MADTKAEKPKGPLGKIKEFSEDKEEQLAILSTFVRLGILVWSGGNTNIKLCYYTWLGTR